jgi:hypothetical protein
MGRIDMKSSRLKLGLKLRSTAILVGAILVVAPRVAHACAMCGLPPGDHATFAFHTSVLFMLFSPYVIFGIVAGIVYVSWRAAIKERRAVGDAVARTARPLGIK